MGLRRRARELVLKVLFHIEFHGDEPDSAFQLICREFQASNNIQDFAKEIVLGIYKNRQKIDRVISEASKNWRLERMSIVDRNLLRISTYEILFRDDIPPKASINEAVELGKRYGQEDSGAFINGILDSIFKRYYKAPDSDTGKENEPEGKNQSGGQKDIV